MKKELEKINNRLEAIEENTDFNFTYGQFALWILILFAIFGGALYFIYN
jgi:hypothetical protein